MLTRLIVLFFLLVCFSANAQEEEPKPPPKIGNQVFLPSLEIGYLFNSASVLSGSVLIKSSIELRLRNNNDLFLRVNYDKYDADYTLEPENNLTNVIKGTAAFTDLLLGPGYRFGDKKYRMFIMVQGGFKYYNFPEFVQNNNVVNLEQGRSRTFTSRATLGLEYYLTEKSAISLDFIQGQVWDKKDFWADSGSALGFSIGFITSLY
ncbi:MAG: hypothetical protein ACFB10_17105 [Salibacteraceae bacterium]|mgnify:CR=1 FL=1